MQTIKAAVLYFGMVFGTGFVLGTVRTLWLVPRVGTRIAELMEQPFMFVVTVVAARWRVHHLAVPSLPIARVEMGGVALALLLAAEFGLATWLRGIPTKEYLTTRDPVSGTIYYVESLELQ